MAAIIEKAIQTSPQQVAQKARRLLGQQIQTSAERGIRLPGFENDTDIHPSSPFAVGIVRLVHERAVTRDEVAAAIGETSAQIVFRFTEPRLLGETLARIGECPGESRREMTGMIEILQDNLVLGEANIRDRRSAEELYLGWLLETERF